MNRLVSVTASLVIAGVSFAFTSGILAPPASIVYPVMPTSLQIRNFVDAGLDTTFSAGSSNSTILLNPIRIAATPSVVFVFDAGDQALKGFGTNGTLLWSTGRQGGGPGEFRKVRALAVGVDGNAVLVDQGNARLSRIGRTGAIEQEISLRSLDGSPEQVMEVAPDTFVIWTLTQEQPLVLLDANGAILQRADVPFRIASQVPYLGAQAKLVNDYRTPRRWVYGFVFVDNWRVLTDFSPTSREYRYIEELPVPVVEVETGRGRVSARMRSAVQGALAASMTGNRLFVLFGGRTQERGQVVDIYDVSEGVYLYSIRLANRASQIAVTESNLIVLAREPYPTVTSLTYSLPRRVE